MIFSKVFIAVAALAISGSVNASPCRPSSGASSSTLLSTSTVSASTSGESSATATETATTPESSTEAESTSTGASTTEFSTTTVETSSTEASSITIEVSSTTAETSTTAEASSTTAETSTAVQTSSTTAEASTSTTSVCVEPTNYVQNPSFENGNEPWRFSSSVGRDPSSNSEGDWTLAITLQEANDLQYAEQDIEGLTPGLEYTMTYQWWTPYISTPNDCYFYTEALGTQYKQSTAMPSPNDYFVEGPSFKFRPMSSTQTIKLGVYCTSEPSFSLNLDSIVILPVQPVCSQGVGGN